MSEQLWEDRPDGMFIVEPSDPPAHAVPNHRASRDEPDAPKPPDTPGKSRLRKMLLGDGPQRTEERPQRTKVKSPPPLNQPGKYVQPIAEFYTAVGMLAMPFNPEFGMTMLGPCTQPTEENPTPDTVAENCARAWDEVAQKNETVRRALEAFTTVSVWGALVIAHTPLIVAAAKGSKLAERINPAAAMEAYLKQRAEAEEQEET